MVSFRRMMEGRRPRRPWIRPVVTAVFLDRVEDAGDGVPPFIEDLHRGGLVDDGLVAFGLAAGLAELAGGGFGGE